MNQIYFGGPIITMEDGIAAEAVAVSEGRISYVGDLDCARRAAPGAEEVDLCGSALAPAFIDAHSHFSAVANSTLEVSLEGARSESEIGRRIKEFIKQNEVKPGEWINANGYDNNILPNGRHPSRAAAGSFAPDNPLVMKHASGHMGVFNERALSELGVDQNTKSPDGGKIDFSAGYMEEAAFFTYIRKVPQVGLQKMLEAYGRAQEIYASHGITTVQEGMAVRQMTPAYQTLLATGALRLDVAAYADMEDAKALFEKFPNSVKKYDRHFKLAGYKMFLDGSPQGRTAWMRTPYLGGKEGYCGYGTMTDGDVLAALRTAKETDMQILAHCNGDAACAQYLAAAKQVPELWRVRPVMIHAQLLGTDQLGEVKELKIIPSFFVAHVYHWGDVHIRNFGLKRASEISPAGEAERCGITFTFHQDSPVIQPDMLETIWCACTRTTAAGELLGENQRISAYSAMKAVTLNAAYQYFEEKEKGSLLPGKKADMVILSESPLEVESDRIREIRVLATIKDGQTL